MLYKIPFESSDWFMVKCPYYNILLKECKGMHKMKQLISSFLYKKNMFLFVQYMFIMSISWKKITWKFQVLKSWNKGRQQKWFIY
jgi:hypothetical protein